MLEDGWIISASLGEGSELLLAQGWDLGAAGTSSEQTLM